MILVDASVALKWFLNEPDAEAAEWLSLNHSLVAPQLIVAEIANGLWKAVRKQAFVAEDAIAAIASLLAQFDLLVPLDTLGERALQIAIQLDHPVYDCFYLAAAEREGLELVTADRRFLKAVEGSAWAPVCRSLS